MAHMKHTCVLLVEENNWASDNIPNMKLLLKHYIYVRMECNMVKTFSMDWLM